MSVIVGPPLPKKQVKPGAINPLKKSQNYAAKAAAARLAKVMQASRDSVDDDDDDDEDDDDHHFPHFVPDGSNARDLSPKVSLLMSKSFS
jgi:hypothetical protein